MILENEKTSSAKTGGRHRACMPDEQMSLSFQVKSFSEALCEFKKGYIRFFT